MPFGVADVKRAGDDVTLVGTSSMVRVCLEAAELLAADGISAEVVDPRTLVAARHDDARRARPQKTGRAIVVDEGHRSYGVTAELAAVIAEGAFYHLDAPGAAARRARRARPVLADARGRDRAHGGADRRHGARALRTSLRRQSDGDPELRRHGRRLGGARRTSSGCAPSGSRGRRRDWSGRSSARCSAST